MLATAQTLQREEQIIAELECLGVRYLSRQIESAPADLRPPHQLLRNLICQPSSRVRVALISLLLAQPEYATHTFAAMALLEKQQVQTFTFFYTAAVHLQQQFENSLRVFLGERYISLPDFFSNKLGVTGESPPARIHMQSIGARLNWAGTDQSAASHLLRRWEMERQWNQ